MGKTSSLDWSRFYRALPRAGRLNLLAAVALLFAPFSLFYNINLGAPAPWYETVLWGIYSSAVAVGWVLAVSYTMKLLFLVVPFSFVIPAYFGRDYWRPHDLGPQALFNYLLCLGTIVTGYVLFIRFIGGEGVKSLRQRTEIALAQQIHESLVPPVRLVTDRYELYGGSETATEVGGDLVDVVRGNGTIGSYVADVTGHGVPAGVMMGMVKSAIRMRLRAGAELAHMVRDLNDVLLEVQKPGMFATFAGLRLGEDRRVEFSLAGHPALLHYRGASRTIESHPADAPPLGVLPGFDFETRSFEVAAGDLLIVLTDGLTEVFDARGEEFGMERFVALAQKNGGRSLPELYAALLGAVLRFGPRADDQTLLLVRAR